MKDKILLFVIGVLVGGIIATGSFFVYTKAVSSNSCDNQTTQKSDENGGMPSMTEGMNGQPPQMPSDSNSKQAGPQNRMNNTNNM